MEPRLKYRQEALEGVRLLFDLEHYVNSSGLEPSLLDLIRVRASQMNGCAYCVDAHARDARSRGETEQRLYALGTWQDTAFYSQRERAALAWTEAVTFIQESRVPDDLYETARQQFSAKELVDLTLAVVAINGWNRLAVAFRTVPGSYQPRQLESFLEHA